MIMFRQSMLGSLKAHGISHELYRELLNFCLQYRSWRKVVSAAFPNCSAECIAKAKENIALVDRLISEIAPDDPLPLYDCVTIGISAHTVCELGRSITPYAVLCERRRSFYIRLARELRRI